MTLPSKRGRSWRWPLVAGAVILVGVIVALVARGGGGEKALDQSLIVKVKRSDLEIAVIETGKVQPREKVEMKSKVAGQVERVFIEEGQRVTKGQLLLRLDATDFRRDVARAEAEVEKAQAEIAQAKNGLAFAQANLERRARGLDSRSVAQIDVDVAQNEVKIRTVGLRSAEVMLSAARVSLGAAEDRLRYTGLVSPMDGTVIQRGIEPGEVVTPGVQATFEGKPLLTIANLATLIVKVDLNQIDVAKVKLGQSVTLTLDALPGHTYEARVSKIAPASTLPKGKDVEVFPVEATLAKADGQIKPGMTADVRIHVETRPKVLVLPIEALAKEGGKSFVTRIDRQAKGPPKTEKVEVKVGVRNDREVELLSGAVEGAEILIKPAAAENEVKM